MMPYRTIRLAAVLVLSLGLALLSLLPALPARAEPRCFPEAAPAITHCIDGRFRTYWEQQGGLPVFGYPLSAPYERSTEAGPITVQLFERARLELHPNNPPPYDVQLSHLGREALAMQGGEVAAPQPPQPGCLFFAQTGQNICSPFLEAWRSFGIELGDAGVSEQESLTLFGLPLTPARPETLSNGQTATVQWFERARFEDHGDHGVLFGLLGREVAGDVDAPAPAWNNPQGDPQEPGGFIEVSGSNLTRLGQVVRLKGVNYYPQWRPWGEMWDKWDGTQMERELRLAHDHLGVNAVRILLPYGVSGDGKVDNKIIRRLREICDIAGRLDMRLIVSLFDFYNTFAPPGSATEQDNFEYLRTLLGNFAGDDRIMAWDVHNEPDHYEKWQQGDADDVLMWLGRMADEIHRLAPNHLVTVGMGQYQNLWQMGPDGRRVIDYSDIVSVHIYNPPDTARQLGELAARTSKPIILEEFGWPSGPPCSYPTYNEASQEQVYQQMLSAAEGRVQGIFAWTLRDFDAGPTTRWDTREEYYGLVRPDDSLKPAAFVFRTYLAAPLPSQTRVAYEPYPSNIRDLKGSAAPELVDASGHYVKSWFRRAWENFGGRGSLGLPLSEAFVRPEDGRVVQYFEAAVLELNDEATEEPGFYELPIHEQIVRAVQTMSLGRAYTEGRTFAPPESAPPDARYFPETGYSVKGTFWSAYENLLGPWRFEAALSNEFVEEVNGTPITVQYFEKGRLEMNPSYNLVIPGQMGRKAWEDRCLSVQ
ncbi:MAG: cellulase family glycosylhydrolase [Chloroflexaceae bacterium]|nr:cellulase family glycosylhydrolase [Chloroflexaceae bacterium]